MSDDFDKDWQRKPDDEPEDDDFGLDWLNDADNEDAPGPDDKRLGVTGELDWLRASRQSGDDDAPTGDDDDFGLDWLDSADDGSPNPGTEGRSGVTGELPWLRDADEEDADAPRDERRLGVTGELSWRQEELEQQLDEAEQASKPPADEDAFDPFSAAPVDDETFEDEDSLDDTPPWLRGMVDDFDDEDEDEVISTPQSQSSGGELPGWLSSTSDIDESDADDEEEDEIPDWMRSIEPMEEASETEDENAIPDWMLGTSLASDFEDEDDDPETSDEMPDWMASVQPIGALDDDEESAAEAEEDDLPDWMSVSFGEATDEDEDEDEDFFSPVEAYDSRQTVPADDDEDEPIDFDTLFGAPDDDADANIADDFDLLGELTADSSEADLAALLAGAQDVDLLDTLDDDGEDRAAANLDDLFGEMEEFTPEAPIRRFSAQPENLDDLFADMDEDDEEQESEAYADFDWSDDSESLQAEDADDMGWLQELESSAVNQDQIGTSDLDARRVAFEAADDDPDLDRDIDDFLASLSQDELVLGATDDLDAPGSFGDDDLDFGGLFDENVEDDAPPAPRREEPELEQGELPEWLTGVSVAELSAAALVRQQQDRPVEELSDRLRNLREQGMQISAGDELKRDNEPATQILSGVDALPLSPLTPDLTGATGEPILTKDQIQRADRLRALVGATTAAAAADALSEEPRRQPRRIRFNIVRFLVAALLLLAVVLPFVPQLDALRLGTLPPERFTLGSTQQQVFEQINSLQSGQYVLFAVEYGPTGAAELDGLTQALMRHALLRGTRPVIVSSSAPGLLRADLLISELAADLERNSDYFVGRFIVAEGVGLRSFVTDIDSLVGTDREGQPTSLGDTITSLDDFELIVVITEGSDSVRNWSEQVAPLTISPLVYAASYAASPLARPYAQANNAGLLVGYRDAYTYNVLLEALLSGGDITPIDPAVLPTAEPTLEVAPPLTATPTETQVTTASPTQAETVAPTETVEAAATEEATPIPGTQEAVPATETPQPTDTIAPTATSTIPPSATPTATATATQPATATEPPPLPTSTPPPTITPEPERFGVVVASTAVNVRSGPGTSFSVIDVVQPGDRVRVIGENDDASWYNIVLEDGNEGWISATLLRLEEGSAAVPYGPMLGMGGLLPRVAQIVTPPGDNAAVTEEPIVTEEPGATEEPIVTEEPGATEEPVVTEEPGATEEPVVTEEPAITPEPGGSEEPPVTPITETDYSDERWYAMTLGLIAAVLIIAAGNFINVVRNLARARAGRKQ